MTSSSNGLSGRRLLVAVLAGLTLLHLVLAVSLPLSGDEIYYWDCSRHADWSTYDQPGLMIWSMIPTRAAFGDGRLAVRLPAIVASLALGMILLPLARRLGGGPRHAAVAYALMHLTPLYFLGSFYASTDVGMNMFYAACVWAAASIAEGQRRAWWGFGLAVGVGFLAKNPIVLVLAALIPALAVADVRAHLRRSTPWLAAATAFALTLPFWLWGWRHHWDNLRFQLIGRYPVTAKPLLYLGQFVAGQALILTPFLLAALGIAWWTSRRRGDPARAVIRVAAVVPFVLFGLASLRTHVAPHWTAPALAPAMVLLVTQPFVSRRRWIVAGGAFGVAVTAIALAVVVAVEPILGTHWTIAGRTCQVSTRTLGALVGRDEMARVIERRLRPGELVGSASYTTVHELAFLSQGRLETRLADLRNGQHGFASLYWYRPEDLVGADMLFATEKATLMPKLEPLFREVEAEAPIQIRRGGRLIRTVYLLRCRGLVQPVPAFTRLPWARGGSQSEDGRGPVLTSNRVARPSSVTSTRMSRPSQAKR